MVYRLLITGGPGSGKTTVIRALEKKFFGRVLAVPEAATMLLQGGFPPPGQHPDLILLRAFQRAIFYLTVELETAYVHQAEKRDAQMIVSDRGRLDGEAYMKGGRDAFLSDIGIQDRQNHLLIYHQIIYLESVATYSPDLWVQNAGNHFRMESDPAVAAAVDRRTLHAWSDHPHVHYFSCKNGIEGKITAVEILVDSLLEKKE
ncbi:MAG: hypothetical protein UU35_C0013G0009 [Candidatus Uhrbacteria bacterium GW2011_GWC2_41_11]|uniref:NadR/Ttd14 AAA domain-containing protein n=1 Tax=Candidatus Uhrbacteria bacterium GW2011_GWC2_41_11 TaxID=1618985 RepID=A0A0G0UBS6_9BACT|nr:MAG: hypothetical protein UU35_C0013G0009 [Candidatus Uhrbacteria bacterium GW2011_GWC2_41_11]HBO99841.1 hypothetical protein [Candidatus Uhrbacteria bacterium]